MARQIRDRDAATLFDTVEEKPGSYYIEAKLHRTHAGVGSWALLDAKGDSDARTKYLKMYPGRVIVRCTYKEKAKKRTVREVRER